MTGERLIPINNTSLGRKQLSNSGSRRDWTDEKGRGDTEVGGDITDYETNENGVGGAMQRVGDLFVNIDKILIMIKMI